MYGSKISLYKPYKHPPVPRMNINFIQNHKLDSSRATLKIVKNTLLHAITTKAYYLWGSNTGVGKTLISAGLAAACTRAAQSLLYLKPVQTGFPTDSDARLVAAAAASSSSATNSSNTSPIIPHFLGPHAAVLDPTYIPPPPPNQSQSQSQSQAWTLFAWSPPVSPHLAVAQHGRPVSDSTILTSLTHHINSNTHALSLIETAGGVASPSPSGRLQCDVLRPLRLPGLLVGDGRLGGISSTLSSWEALHRRGYDVPFIVIADDEKRALGNSVVVRGAVVGRGVVDVVELPPLPTLPHSNSNSNSSTNNIIDPMLQEWLEESSSQFDSLLINMKQWHTDRLATLASSPSRAEKTLWWPFTQHGSINNNTKTMVIDGRAGEFFLTISNTTSSSSDSKEEESGSNTISTKDMEMVPLYDGCASWWTQGVGSHQQQDIADAISHAAARYGHVMFPENTHQPALNVAEKLLSTVGDGWADRVFYSDNGSTAIEVAIKMAFRKYMMDHDIPLDNDNNNNNNNSGVDMERGGRGSSSSPPPPPPSLGIIGIQEAYHGDTLGAMDAVAPSVFNGRRQTPWYTGRGLFLPAKLFAGSSDSSSSSSSIDRDKDKDALALYFNGKIDEYEFLTPNHRLGALILEPVMQGAGGMRVIDPVWQSTLVKVCKERKIPVIYDEVFTGLFRLGWKSAGPAVLDMAPDIACYAKLLTGGMVPLAVTLASADVFNCFLGSTKIQALLHGHSYTAHAIGCAAAEYSLDTFFSKIKGGERLGVLWDVDQAQHIAEKLGGVERVTALGTVLVFDFGDAGSDRARTFALLLKQYAGIYTRPLGGVTYLMVTPLTTKEECRQLLNRVEGAVINGGGGNSGGGNKKMCVIHDGQFM